MIAILEKFANWVLALLPTSPFQVYIHSLGSLPFMGYLNWFIPVNTFVAIGQAWLVAIGLFYLYSIILRWVRAIS